MIPALEVSVISYLEQTLATPAENLALDEALLLEAEAGRSSEVLRIWELPDYAVVLGSSSIVQDDVSVDACLADGIPILRRCSGGGTVLLGKGCLAFSLVLKYERAAALADVTHSYAYILEQLATVLQVRRAGTSDLVVGDQKISGNSQRCLRHHLLHHGTILYAFDIAQIGCYLLQPPRQPAYRHGRHHEQFVTNLTVPREELVVRLRRAWNAAEPCNQLPSEVARELTKSKYSSNGWTWRR